MTDYDDYYDAAKKDGEPVIQGEHGGSLALQIYRAVRDDIDRRQVKRDDIDCFDVSDEPALGSEE